MGKEAETNSEQIIKLTIKEADNALAAANGFNLDHKIGRKFGFNQTEKAFFVLCFAYNHIVRTGPQNKPNLNDSLSAYKKDFFLYIDPTQESVKDVTSQYFMRSIKKEAKALEENAKEKGASLKIEMLANSLFTSLLTHSHDPEKIRRKGIEKDIAAQRKRYFSLEKRNL